MDGRETEKESGSMGDGLSEAFTGLTQKLNLDSNRYMVSIRLKSFGKNKFKSFEFGNSNEDFETVFEKYLSKHFVRNGPVLVESVRIYTTDPTKPHMVNRAIFKKFLGTPHSWEGTINNSFALEAKVDISNFKAAKEKTESVEIIKSIQNKLKVLVEETKGKTGANLPVTPGSRAVFAFLFSDRVPFVRFPTKRILVIKDDSESILYYCPEKESVNKSKGISTEKRPGRFVTGAEKDNTYTQPGMVKYTADGKEFIMPAAAVYTLMENTDPTMEAIKTALFSNSSRDTDKTNGCQGKETDSPAAGQSEKEQCAIL